MGEGVTEPMMTSALIWMARRGKLWVLLKKPLLRQQGEPSARYSVLPPSVDPAGWTVSSWRAGLGLNAPLSPRHWAHSGCSINMVG